MSAPSAAVYPTDKDRIDEYLDDKRVIGVCPPPLCLESIPLTRLPPPVLPYPTPRTSPTPFDDDGESALSTPTTSSASASIVSLTDTSYVQYDPLIQPALIKHEIVPSPRSRQTIAYARYEASRIIAGKDDRVIVIVGPCSIHSPQQAIEYAHLLKAKIPSWPNLLIVMRSYFEKPRTTVGWKGLINDPDIDGSFKINKGLRIARQLLCDLTDLGVPVGLELLDTISPQYLADLVSWGAIGARTTESQLHRELASGSSFPIGFKNGTDGSVTVAVDAMRSAERPHAFMGVTTQGLAAIVKTRGNTDVHIILRGGSSGPNYAPEHVEKAAAAVKKARPDYHNTLMVDCSHGNSSKNHLNQPVVIASLSDQISAGSTAITGVMLESHINGGRQDIPKVLEEGKSVVDMLKHGVSITDACVDWAMTVDMLDGLNEAVGKRRTLLASHRLNGNGNVNGSSTGNNSSSNLSN